MPLSPTRYENGAFCIRQFLEAQECDELIRKSEALGFSAALINTSMGALSQSDVRNNQRILFDDYALAAQLFERLRPFIPDELDNWAPNGCNEKFRFYKYIPGQYFKWHVDGSFKRDYFEVSKLTVLLYLNAEFEGGETEFDGFAVAPEKGMLLIFPHKLRHQGAPLISGAKYVLRTDVMYAKV